MFLNVWLKLKAFQPILWTIVIIPFVCFGDPSMYKIESACTISDSVLQTLYLSIYCNTLYTKYLSTFPFKITAGSRLLCKQMSGKEGTESEMHCPKDVPTFGHIASVPDAQNVSCSHNDTHQEKAVFII